LEPAAFSTWLDHRAFSVEEAMEVVRPAPNEALELVEVGSAVGSVANEGAQLQEPATVPGPTPGEVSRSRKPNDNLNFDF
jgi:putative SOS response-associated peptidase YedK